MSIYKKFRSVTDRQGGSLSTRYDQPSYLTFKLLFAQNRDINYNDAGKLIQRTLNYDIMPHPLFGVQGADDVNNRETYSAIDYLLDSNEFTRAAMLEEFIEKFNELQFNFQWYFKSIEGVEELLKIKTDYGQRIPSDKRIVINMLEGVDLRVTHLMNLYRKIAWDDKYQRWVLPDMMRYFTLRIYVTEFRTFHQVSPNIVSGSRAGEDLVLSVMDNVLPTWIIECEMCEFDLESFKFGYLNSLDVAESPNEASTSFSIKVGKIYESQIYPLFKNAYLIDKNINGSDRLKESDGAEPFDSTSPLESNNYYKYLYNDKIAQNTIDDSSSENIHLSGRPYNQNANETTLLDSADTAKNTWISNAVKSGVAIATNYANQWIDQLKMTPIPRLGASVTEMGAALESKNIFTVLGMIRKSVEEVKNELIDPSEKLSESIVDSTFRSLLEGLATSTATGRNLDLSAAAGLVLNDKGIWDAIRDFSKSTNMVGPGEINDLVKIENPDIYKNIVMTDSGNDRSKATDLDGGPISISYKAIQTAPDSVATTNKLVL